MKKYAIGLIVFVAGLFPEDNIQAAQATFKVIGSPVSIASKDIELAKTITLGNSAADCTMIGYAPSTNLAQLGVDTNGRTGYWYISVVGGQEVCTGRYADYKIYKTSVDGIGISYNNSDSGSDSGAQLKPIPAWPGKLKKMAKNGTNVSTGTHVTVRLWRYSSAANSLPYGLTTIKGHMILHVVGPQTGDTLGLCINTVTQSNTCYVNQINTVQITQRFYSSTCNFVNGSKIVQMGKHQVLPSSTQGVATPWVDASFKIHCPNASGYFTDTTNPSPSTIPATLNKTVTITVHALNGYEDINNGIIKVDPLEDHRGAKGIGIQLAWGDHSSIGPTPLKPVKFDVPIAGNTISSNIQSGPYPEGSKSISGDGTIKMAARYIRTGVPLVGGAAKAKIEVMANYQ